MYAAAKKKDGGKHGEEKIIFCLEASSKNESYKMADFVSLGRSFTFVNTHTLF